MGQSDDILVVAHGAHNAEIAKVNIAYEEAVAAEDEEAIAALRAQGAELNKFSPAAFKEVQKQFFKADDIRQMSESSAPLFESVAFTFTKSINPFDLRKLHSFFQRKTKCFFMNLLTF